MVEFVYVGMLGADFVPHGIMQPSDRRHWEFPLCETLVALLVHIHRGPGVSYEADSRETLLGKMHPRIGEKGNYGMYVPVYETNASENKKVN